MKEMNLFSTKNTIKSALVASALLLSTTFTAYAAVVQSVGSGSAVSTVDAVANFESMNALSDNPYIENGISFSRTGLSFNNNGCGYAGCAAAFPSSFTGNYMYGVGNGGYFQITAESGKSFQGLEFISGSGFGTFDQINFLWQATLNGSVVNAGTGTVSPGTVLGFSDASGFDSLRWTETYSGAADFNTSSNAPAFDSVRAQYVQGGQALPEPATTALIGLGLLGFAASRRKYAKNKNA